MREHPTQSLERMEAMLRQCRRHILMAQVSARLREGLDLFLKCLLGLAALFLILRVLAYAVELPGDLNRVVLPAIAAILAAVIFVRALVLGLRGEAVHMDAAAERLDLSQSTHNRIATAIALLRSGDESPFAAAAIEEGFEYLEKLQSEAPHIGRATCSWRRKGAWLAISLATILAGIFLEAGPRSARKDNPALSRNAPPVNPVAPLLAPDPKDEPKQQLASRAERLPAGTAPVRSDDPADSARDEHAAPHKDVRSEGLAGQHASGRSRASQSPSSSSSAASGAGAKSEPGTSEPEPGRKPREAKGQAAAQPKPDFQEKKGGSINARGSSGAGSMRSAQNDWSSEVKAKSSDTDDSRQEEEPDEEMDPDKQRMGMQPALQNRSSHVSRELSLGMGRGANNDPSKGRGGPGAQKKKRGTATMMMGVPVPGFVKGRLLPGPTKSTQEEVEPIPREGAYATASDLQTANPEETPQERYRPTAVMNVQARDYLLKYHTENENELPGTPKQ